MLGSFVFQAFDQIQPPDSTSATVDGSFTGHEGSIRVSLDWSPEDDGVSTHGSVSPSTRRSKGLKRLSFYKGSEE